MVDNLEERVKKVEERNQRVEGDKAWETSWSRKIILFILTYVAIGLYLRIIDIGQPWLNAIVPALAFVISTLTMPFFKEIWLKYINKK